MSEAWLLSVSWTCYIPLFLARGKRHVYACIKHNKTSLKNITEKNFSELCKTDGSLLWIPASRQLYLSADIHRVSCKCETGCYGVSLNTKFNCTIYSIEFIRSVQTEHIEVLTTSAVLSQSHLYFSLNFLILVCTETFNTNFVCSSNHLPNFLLYKTRFIYSKQQNNYNLLQYLQ